MKAERTSHVGAESLAIIRRVQSYSPYQITKIGDGALAVLGEAASTLPLLHKRLFQPLAKLLECYLCVTEQRLDCVAPKKLQIGTLADEFVGALYSERFFEASIINRYALVRAWNALISVARTYKPSSVKVLLEPSSTHVHIRFQPLMDAFEKKSLNADEVFYWRHSQIQNRRGTLVWIPLRSVGIRFGRRFAEYLYDACHTHVFANNGRVGEINLFLTFLVTLPNSYTANSFVCKKIMAVIWKLFKRHFVDTNLGPSTYKNVSRSWELFLVFAKANLHGQGPFGRAEWNLTSLPKMDDGGQGPNIREDESGKLVAHKLLIDVPLEMTDEAALQIIFEDLTNRVATISIWGKYLVNAIWLRHLRRIESAATGDVASGRILNPESFSDKDIANMAAKFQNVGFQPTGKRFTSLATPLLDAAFQLGLPTTGTLLPHLALLVIAHPQLTPSFFDNFELYDKFGQVSGLVPTKNGSMLVGYKNRWGAKLAQQEILLTPETEELVNQVIELTNPLRDYLKRQGDDEWRKLFLTCGQGFGYPKGIKSTGLTADSYRVRELKKDFVRMHLVSSVDVAEFVARFSLVSLRASTAVLSYIENPDVTAFAKILGHFKYSPRLLARYMPAPLLTFYQQRWVRLFQCAIIATAMAESPYALQATGFETTEQLHSFLKNHALKLKDRPRNFSDSRNTMRTPSISAEGSGIAPEIQVESVIFGVSVENLTVLLGLMQAVDNADYPVNFISQYWVAYGKRLVAHIDMGDEYCADLKDFLLKARAVASPAGFESLIRA